MNTEPLNTVPLNDLDAFTGPPIVLTFIQLVGVALARSRLTAVRLLTGRVT